MQKYIIEIWLKNKFRKVDLYRNIIAILILISMICLYIYHNKDTVYLMIHFLKNINIEIIIIQNIYIFTAIDFLIKIIFKKDILTMPDYMKVRNISQKAWNKFIILYNITNIWNLYQIVLLSLVLYAFTKTLIATLIIILIYFVSLLNSLFLSTIRKIDCIQKKSNFAILWIVYILFLYLSSKTDLKPILDCIILIIINLFSYILIYRWFYKLKKYDENFSHISLKRKTENISLFSIEYISLFRSKRLMQLLLLSAILLLTGIYFYKNDPLLNLMCYLYLSVPTLSLGQYILGIEANYFCGIWTKPYPLKIILVNKYRFYILLNFVYLIFLIPLIVLENIDLLNIFSTWIYIGGFVNILYFPLCLFANRINLNHSTFMYNQGFSSVTFIYGILIFFFSIWVYNYIISNFNNNISYLLLSLIGLLAYMLKDLFFSGVCYLFEMNRYKIMERFRTK